MSYMKHYAMWCQEQGYLDENFKETNPNEDSMQHVDRYLRENPHMKPIDRFAKETFGKPTALKFPTKK